MKLSELRTALIPTLKNFCGAPIIQGDQIGSKPDVAHATYKFTTPYGKSAGREEEVYIVTETGAQIKRIVEYRTVMSVTAYSMDDDESVDLAQKIHDWFAFDGADYLNSIGVVIAEQTDVTNRDAFVVENYERRNGFDVIMRIKSEKTRDVDWFDNISGITN